MNSKSFLEESFGWYTSMCDHPSVLASNLIGYSNNSAFYLTMLFTALLSKSFTLKSIALPKQCADK
ncbi:hypothetical protein [Romboutsia timonensis]|uniref:hypothetical protein n=1 Tax=Romboutsia timonensis TaxID=1776391 RepID=UPI0020582A5A|nr:hypothetical protein [Romboutsia timonensis]DAX04686.1 MAG TPA: hypothetical protein [Bacteriophage sp.]